MVVRFHLPLSYNSSQRRTHDSPPSNASCHRKLSSLFTCVEFWLIGVITLAALSSPFQAASLGGPFVFGLDNRPQAPISIDPLGFGNGAEDPFGLVPSPVQVGPSPSLNTFSVPLGRTLSDADTLAPGSTTPQVDTMRPLNTNYIDEISSNRAVIHGKPLRLAFSVDRASTGVAPSAVHSQFLLNQHPADIFVSDRDFPAPGMFVGISVGFGWWGNLSSVGGGSGNALLRNQADLKLTAGAGPGIFVGPNTLAPSILPGSHDNVDAFDIAPLDTSGDLISDKYVYFSVNPDQRVLNPVSYSSAADIYSTVSGSQTPALFANAILMGLDGMGQNSDDLDGLELYDRGVVGLVEPGVDYALFSLSPGSRSLQTFPGINAADIFFTDFRQSFATFAADEDLGLSGTINPAELDGGGETGHSSGLSGTDNLDALGSYPLGDMDWSGSLDLSDVDDFVQGLTRPTEYRDVNVDHFGQPATVLGDFSVPRDGLVDFDDVVPFRAAIQAVVNPASGKSVPEPAMFSLTFIALAMFLPCQRRRSPNRGFVAR